MRRRFTGEVSRVSARSIRMAQESRPASISARTNALSLSRHATSLSSAIALAKLVSWRDKDRAFVRALIDAGLLSCAILRERAETLDTSPVNRRRILRWIALFS